MEKVKGLEFSPRQDRKMGFEILKLEDFFKSMNTSYISKPYRTGFYNLIFVNHGKGHHEIDFVDYEIKAGEILLISRNRVHRYVEFENLEGYIVMFTEGFLCECLSNQDSDTKDLFKSSFLYPHLKELDVYVPMVKSSLDVLSDMYKNSNQIVDKGVVALSFKLTIRLLMNVMSQQGSFNYSKNQLFTRFSELVEEHISTEKSVDGYAKMLYVSSKTVNTVTRNAIDMSAKQYITEQLVLRIQRKLSFDQKNINEIADDLGFSEPSNLTRFFKKNTGMTPQQFREEVGRGHQNWISDGRLELEVIKEAIEKNVYCILDGMVVPLHKHEEVEELFYCFKGFGFVVLEHEEVAFEVGDVFVASSGQLHSLRSDGELYVTSFIIPVIEERS